METLYITTEYATYVWHGGAYIDIHGQEDVECTGRTFDCINVWDYATDVPTIARTEEGMREAIDEYEAEWLGLL